MVEIREQEAKYQDWGEQACGREAPKGQPRSYEETKRQEQHPGHADRPRKPCDQKHL